MPSEFIQRMVARVYMPPWFVPWAEAYMDRQASGAEEDAIRFVFFMAKTLIQVKVEDK